MPWVNDQMGRRVDVPGSPQRIISLVPSQTELLYDLGLGDRVVGITKFCVHPDEWFKSKPKVGGTKQYRLEVIRSLKPDLVLGNKEENEEQGIEQLAQEFPVWMSDIATLDDAIGMIQEIGDLTESFHKAQALIKTISREFQDLISESKTEKVLYLIWRKPFMAAGKATFIDEMIQKTGLSNCLEGLRYPELSAGDLEELKPDYVFLSSEPYPFANKHIEELESIFPNSKVVLVDGEMFSWYGSRLLKAPGYFQELRNKMGSLQQAPRS